MSRLGGATNANWTCALDEERSAFTLGETRAKRLNSQNFPRIVAATGIRCCRDGHRDIVFHKPKRTARDIEEHSFSDLQGGGRRFEAYSAHPKPQVRASPPLTGRVACDQLFVYAYGDWLTRHGGMAPLAEAAGLQLVSALSPSVGLAQALQRANRTEPRDES